MISVIIPCYNSEEYIGRAIESVLNQTYQDYEIIVVDNGSKDNTRSILNGYRERYPNLIKIFNEPKKGAPAARNKGLNEAQGEWIQFLDSDDELLPDKFKVQIEIANRSNIDIVAGSLLIYKNNGNVRLNYDVDSTDVWQALLTSELGRTSGNLWRRKAVLQVHGWNEKKTSSQEYDLMFRMLKLNDQAGFSKRPLAITHVRDGSIHISNDLDRNIEIINNFVKLRTEIKEYLKSRRMLTSKIKMATDISIFIYLNKFGSIAPDHVQYLLKELNLNLPLSFLIKRKLRNIKLKLKDRARLIFPVTVKVIEQKLNKGIQS